MSALSGSYIPTLPPHVVREDVLMLGFVYAGRIRTASRVFVASGRIGGASVRVRTGRSLSTVVLARGGEVQSIHTFLDSTEGSSLYGTTGHEVELGTIDEVLEVRTRGKQDVHRLDILRRELLHRRRTLATERDAEGSKRPELHLLPVQELFHQTLAGIRENTLYGTTAEYPVVVGNVLGKLLQWPDFRHLVLGIHLLGQLRLQRIAHHVNTKVNHKLKIFKSETINYMNLNARCQSVKERFQNHSEPVPLCF